MTRILRSVADMRAFRQSLPNGASIGFVPTMGALHKGHLELVRLAKRTHPTVIVSIFVNPAQFAPHEDFSKYPRVMDSDMEMLKQEGVHGVFTPSVVDIYPTGITQVVADQIGSFVSVQGLSEQMEGSVRPHFFRGVATVVTKLLNAVQPDTVFLGQKDAQQCVVVKRMVTDLLMPFKVQVAPTHREYDGLAMSSRNRYLSTDERQRAPVLYRALQTAIQMNIQDNSAGDIKSRAKSIIEEEPNVQLDYLSIASPETLQELHTIDPSVGAIFSGAIRVGKTRIIDNILLNCKL